MAKGTRSALGAISVVVGFVGLGVGLSGCPVAAPLENEDRFDALGQSGTNGTAGSGAMNCNQDLPDVGTIGCDYQSFLRSHCARGGCHNQGTNSASLDLTADTLLIARILEVPARHLSIKCPGNVTCDHTAVPPACDKCASCTPGDFLLTKEDFEQRSWIIKKMAAFNVDTPSTAPEMMCGTAMPYPPGGTGFTNERRDCLKTFFSWVANNGRACSLPMGGSGGGGAGGAGTAGAGAGGAGSGGGGAGGT